MLGYKIPSVIHSTRAEVTFLYPNRLHSPQDDERHSAKEVFVCRSELLSAPSDCRANIGEIMSPRSKYGPWIEPTFSEMNFFETAPGTTLRAALEFLRARDEIYQR